MAYANGLLVPSLVWGRDGMCASAIWQVPVDSVYDRSMTIHGPEVLETDEACFTVGRTLVDLQRKLRDDLLASRSDGITERPTLGFVFCLRAILEATPERGFCVHTADVSEWKEQYLEWFKANSKKIRPRSGGKKLLKERAIAEFDRLLELSQATAYRLDVR